MYGAGKEICVNIDGKHFHVLICVECHLKEIGMTFSAAVQMMRGQQSTIEKLTKRRDLEVIQ
jgi:hypothetical protein